MPSSGDAIGSIATERGARDDDTEDTIDKDDRPRVALLEEDDLTAPRTIALSLDCADTVCLGVNRRAPTSTVVLDSDTAGETKSKLETARRYGASFVILKLCDRWLELGIRPSQIVLDHLSAAFYQY